MREQVRIIGFAAIVCLVCSVLLALVSAVLTPRQSRNKANDVKRKVLQVFGESVTDAKGRLTVSPPELDRRFENTITGIVLNAEGKVMADRRVAELSPKAISEVNPETGLKRFYPLYIYTDPETSQKQYAIHISGKGLWSTIKGFMALKGDFSTITGVVFYEHQETPGLGGEIEKPFFQERFKGKQWLADGTVQTFRITKPGNANSPHAVDGITAATITCQGVQEFLNRDFRVYNRYFQTLRESDE